MHEAQTNKPACFLTLTLNDENLPGKYFTGQLDENLNPVYAGTLEKRQLQLFLKRLRQHILRNYPKSKTEPTKGKPPFPLNATENRFDKFPRAKNKIKITPFRYYMCGEYGEKYRRPHYHICIFGYEFADRTYWRKSPSGEKLYRSKTLEKLWPLGHSTIGDVTFESAAYVARYVMKKVNGEKQKKHYEVIDKDTGEIKEIIPEYNDMSRRPGLGTNWIKKYTADVYPQGRVIVRGKPSNAPRFYDKYIRKEDYYTYDELKLQREHDARQQYLEQTHERLRVREQVTLARIKSLKRNKI